MPSLHPFTFLMFFKSCFCTFLMLMLHLKPKNISFKCNSTTPGEAIKPGTERNGTEPEVIDAQYGRGH